MREKLALVQSEHYRDVQRCAEIAAISDAGARRQTDSTHMVRRRCATTSSVEAPNCEAMVADISSSVA